MRHVVATARRRQRVVLAITLVLAVVLCVLTVSADEPAAALAECGPGDVHRNTLALGASDAAVRPCVAGTNLKIKVPRTCLLTVCENKYKVSEIRRHGRERVTYADGTSHDLWHFTFKALTFNRDVTMSTTDNAAGRLSIAPERAAHIGGTDEHGDAMYTDVWVSEGTFNITFTDLPSVLACTLTIPADSPLVEVVQGGTIRGCGLDLDVKYLVSYSPTQAGSGSPVRLPDTTLRVTP